MSALRDTLAVELAKKVTQHRLVLWQDTDGEYVDVAAEICPPQAAFEPYGGSWYELRSRVEPLLAAEEPPCMVVYVPVRAPEDDPLLELRVAAKPFVRRLGTLVRDALGGELSEQRIGELADAARAVLDVEAALESGESADVRLVRALGSSDTTQIVTKLTLGEHDDVLDAEGMWEVAAAFVADRLGGQITGAGDTFRGALLRQLVLTEIAAATGRLPEDLESAWTPVSAEQRRRSLDLVDRWRRHPETSRVYTDLVREAESSLALAPNLVWMPGLETCHAAPAVDTKVLTHAVDLLGEGAWHEAAALALSRSQGPWCRPDVDTAGWTGRASRWQAVQATAELRHRLESTPPPQTQTGAEVLAWYADEGWEVDRTHRHYELARGALESYGDLDVFINQARAAYEAWLDAIMQAMAVSVVQSGLDSGGLVHQGDIHDRWVRTAEGSVAYVWVDALRYELGCELADQLSGLPGRVETHAAVAAVPTITPVGMADLTPDAGGHLSLTVSSGKLAVTVDGQPVATVKDRVDRLRAAHAGGVLDQSLDTVAEQSERELHKQLGTSAVALIRSQELDVQGESGMLQAAWPQFSLVVQILARVVARLGHAGVGRVVITSDHGFIALPRSLEDDRTIDAPVGGTGELHRRVWVGTGGTTPPAAIRVPVSEAGTPGDVDLITPRGLAVFKSGGSRQFFHGGLSPQEVVIPVVVVDFAEAAPAPNLEVSAEIAGGRIMTGTFAAALEFTGDLFTSEIAVRAVAQGRQAGQVVARVVSGDGYDSQSGTVTLQQRQTPVLAFQVTENLTRGDIVRLEVLDAKTGVRLGSTEAEVAADIAVKDDLA
ncbi:MAG: PglZ domain-containing protein [Acidimicrobiia bacterium]|nr:PglZ domain-containing protein [Acidimicrobiia bacterium]